MGSAVTRCATIEALDRSNEGDPWRPGPEAPTRSGATFDGSGTNFAIFSEHAERVELCLFDGPGGCATETRVELTEVDGFVWHCYLPTVQPGQRYGYRVHGPYEPEQGLRFNPDKLLLDPYAKATAGSIDWDPSLYSYDFGDPDSRNDDDSAAHMLHGVVINPFFDWEGDRRLNIPYNESLIYEAHVKGLTQLHPEIPEELRGTYAGLAHPAITNHLTKLGVTAIELMPVHQFVHDSDAGGEGAAQLLGLQHPRLLRAAPGVLQRRRRRGQDRPAGAGVQADGALDARGRHRGDPRRRLQPHGRGQPPRARR